ncbi:hypothetical protein J0A71_03g06120 [Encephalitozoon cuniculi]|uniref:Uncharacterized protein n=1 Tax=Encephalitozoon cuniculi TaxID=6035 RepID=M1KMB8_ENCCN|nr:hypothetical protein [Encephalitozoon cuniculi]UYI26775.1 hypothetical protein J0A71_03g06120 [Encephalitozoon cuniculi]
MALNLCARDIAPMSSIEEGGLEKRIHKAALLETVAVLNEAADGKRGKKNGRRASPKGEKREGQKKDMRSKADKPGTRPGKQKRNAVRKLGKRTDEENTREDKDATESLRKMTRKERRLEKLRSRGKGPSSKEYYEKFIKKHKDNGDSPQKKITRDTLPSKRKEDFPMDDEGKKRRGQ